MTLSEQGYLYIVYKTCKVLKYVLIANMQDHHYTLHNYQTVVCGTDNMAFAEVIQCSGSYFAPWG